jgi:hypothetical protein
MNPVVSTLVSGATYTAVFWLGAWWRGRTHRHLLRRERLLLRENRRLKRELRSAALQAARCYQLGYQLGVDDTTQQFNPTYHEIDPETSRWSSN